MPNPLDSARLLRQLASPSNVRRNTSPFLARRQDEIYSGLDEFVPEQDEDGLPRSAGARSADIARLRQLLGLGRVKHEQEVERTAVAPRVAGEYGLRERRLTNEGALAERDLANRGALDVERERQSGARDINQQRLSIYETLAQGGITPSRVSSGGVSVTTGQGGQPRVPTQGQTRALQQSREGYGTGLIDRMLPGMMGGGNRKQAYLSALSDVLVRTGSYEWIAEQAETARAEGLSATDAIAQASEQGVQLDPYEQEYLKLVLGE